MQHAGARSKSANTTWCIHVMDGWMNERGQVAVSVCDKESHWHHNAVNPNIICLLGVFHNVSLVLKCIECWRINDSVTPTSSKVNKLSKKRMKNAHHDSHEPKVTSSSWFFRPTSIRKNPQTLLLLPSVTKRSSKISHLRSWTGKRNQLSK